jgi:hypothetical protein
VCKFVGTVGDAVLDEWDGEGAEGVGLDDIGSGFEVPGVEGCDDIGPGDVEDLVAPAEVRAAEIVVGRSGAL